MNILEQILYYAHMIFICSMLTLVIILGILYYFLKVKKITATVENINTSYFKREDTISYVPFRDIASLNGEFDADGMYMISDTVFVGGISVRGFQYGAASRGEQVDAQIYSVAFFNVVESLTSFRQSRRRSDLSANIEEYDEALKKTAMEQMELDAEYKATVIAADDYIDVPEKYEMYEKRIQELHRELVAKSHMIEECEAVIGYMKALSGDADNKKDETGERAAQIMFSYEFNPDEHNTELSKEEIYMEAQEALNTKAASYIEALSYCHFKAKRLTAKELAEMVYQCTSPVTWDDTDIRELLDSSHTALFVSSNSVVEAMVEKIGEDKYKEQLEKYEKALETLLKEQELDRERTAQLIKEEALKKAHQIYQMHQEGV